MRLFQQFQRFRLAPSQLSVFAFEPDADNIAEMARRLASAAGWQSRVTVTQGLVGAKKSGEGTYWKSHQHHSCTALSGRRYAGSWEVIIPYVDIEAIIPPGDGVDLIKCDIEGAERDFVESHPELLRRTIQVVMEIHDPQDVPPIKAAMNAAGLVHAWTAADHGSNAVWIFSRAPLSTTPETGCLPADGARVAAN